MRDDLVLDNHQAYEIVLGGIRFTGHDIDGPLIVDVTYEELARLRNQIGHDDVLAAIQAEARKRAHPDHEVADMISGLKRTIQIGTFDTLMRGGFGKP